MAAEAAGAELLDNVHVVSLLRDANGQVCGVKCADGSELRAEHVVLALGARVGALLPHLRDFFSIQALPLLFIKPAPEDVEDVAAMPCWAASVGIFFCFFVFFFALICLSFFLFLFNE